MIVKSLRKLAGQVAYLFWNIRQLQSIKQIRDFDRVVVLDIDNTLTKSTLGYPIDHINPTPRKELINHIQEKWCGKDHVIFLSARRFTIYNDTLDWLQTQGFEKLDKDNLFLVKSSMAKLKYLEILCTNNKSVLFVDDLSYNHEYGVVLEYTDVAQRLKGMSIKYLGIHFIDDFQ